MRLTLRWRISFVPSLADAFVDFRVHTWYELHISFFY